LGNNFILLSQFLLCNLLARAKRAEDEVSFDKWNNKRRPTVGIFKVTCYLFVASIVIYRTAVNKQFSTSTFLSARWCRRINTDTDKGKQQRELRAKSDKYRMGRWDGEKVEGGAPWVSRRRVSMMELRINLATSYVLLAPTPRKRSARNSALFFPPWEEATLSMAV